MCVCVAIFNKIYGVVVHTLNTKNLFQNFEKMDEFNHFSVDFDHFVDQYHHYVAVLFFFTSVHVMMLSGINKKKSGQLTRNSNLIVFV